MIGRTTTGKDGTTIAEPRRMNTVCRACAHELLPKQDQCPECGAEDAWSIVVDTAAASDLSWHRGWIGRVVGAGIAIGEDQVAAGMAEFAGRANLDTEQFVQAIGQGGVAEHLDVLQGSYAAFATTMVELFAEHDIHVMVVEGDGVWGNFTSTEGLDSSWSRMRDGFDTNNNLFF